MQLQSQRLSLIRSAWPRQTEAQQEFEQAIMQPDQVSKHKVIQQCGGEKCLVSAQLTPWSRAGI